MPIYKTKNEDFFKKWTPEMAYVLGFIAADGTLIKNKRGAHFLEIHITDREIIEGIRKAFESNHKISTRRKVENQKQTYRLQIGSKIIFNDLVKLGITPKKTKRMPFPKIPPRYLPDFVRGYFDGDGNVWCGLIHKERKTKTLTLRTVFTSGNKFFIQKLKDILWSNAKINGFLSYHSRAHHLVYSVWPSLFLYKFMYNNAGLYLQRKRRIFEFFLKTRSFGRVV